MATDEQPRRRRHSPAVYRRRRLVLLVGVLAVVALVAWLLIAQPWRGAAAEASAPAASPSHTPDAAATELPVPGAQTPAATTDPTTDSTEPNPTITPTAKACVSSDVLVEGVTDQESYGPGANPQLSIRLTNNGATDCTLNVGTTTQAFTIMSGDDIWWRSTDCQTEPSDMVVLLAAGQSVTSAAPLTWDRTRSSVDSCDSGTRPVAGGGGASYHLSVSIGGVDSLQSTQFFLN